MKEIFIKSEVNKIDKNNSLNKTKDNWNNNSNNEKYKKNINLIKGYDSLIKKIFIDKTMDIWLEKSLLVSWYLTPYEYLEKIKNNYFSNLVYYLTLKGLFRDKIDSIRSQKVEGIINNNYKKEISFYLYVINKIQNKIQEIIKDIQKEENYTKDFLNKINQIKNNNLNKLTSFFGDINWIHNYIKKFRPTNWKESKNKYYNQIIKDADLNIWWSLNKGLDYKNLWIDIDRYISEINNKIKLNIINSTNEIELLTKDQINSVNSKIRNEKHMIKLSSIIWQRKLTKWRKWYHLWIDITLANLQHEISRNCSGLKNKDILSFLNRSSFNKDLCILNKKIINTFLNYKKIYNLIISLNIKNLNKNKNQCYIWIHRSLYSPSKLIGYWYFILCQTDDHLRNLYWHTNITFKQIKSLLRKWYLVPVNYWTNYIKLIWLINWFYQKNYLTFNRTKLDWDWPAILQFDRSLLLPNKIFYRINYKKILQDWFKYLNIPYWNSGFSSWKHIHYALLYQLWEFVSPVWQTDLLLKIISKQLWINLTLKDNYYYFWWINY